MNRNRPLVKFRCKSVLSDAFSLPSSPCSKIAFLPSSFSRLCSQNLIRHSSLSICLVSSLTLSFYVCLLGSLLVLIPRMILKRTILISEFAFCRFATLTLQKESQSTKTQVTRGWGEYIILWRKIVFQLSRDFIRQRNKWG